MACQHLLQVVGFGVTGSAPAEIQHREDSWDVEKKTEAKPNPKVRNVGGELWPHDERNLLFEDLER
jgi:hypothetical protein